MKVVCVYNRGYYNLTEGKEYEVVELYPPAQTESGFVYPKFVKVIDDNGKESMGHAYRFKTLDGVSCEDVINN